MSDSVKILKSANDNAMFSLCSFVSYLYCDTENSDQIVFNGESKNKTEKNNEKMKKKTYMASLSYSPRTLNLQSDSPNLYSIRNFCLIRLGNLETLKALSLTPMLNQPFN